MGRRRIALTCELLGVWQIGSRAGVGYQADTVAWSDYVAGAVAFVLSMIASRRRQRGPAESLLCALGVWQLHAQLVFHTPS